MHFQIDRRLDDAGLEALEAALRGCLSRRCGSLVRDFLPMVDRVERMIEAAAGRRRPLRGRRDARVDRVPELAHRRQLHLPRLPRVRVAEATGARPRQDRAGTRGSASSRREPLGSRRRCRWRELDEPCARGSSAAPLVIVSKTNAESTIHRQARMDYIGVKRVDAAGEIVGELRLIGLFTSQGLRESARQIPLVRRKLESIIAVGGPDRRLARLQGGRRALRQLPQGRAVRGRRPRSCARRSWRCSGCRRSAPCASSCGATRCGAAWRRWWRCPATTSRPSFASGSSTCSSCGSAASRSTTPLVRRDRPGPVPLHDPRPDGRDPRPAAGRPPAGGGRAPRARWDDALSDALVPQLGEARGHELARRYAAPLPRLLQVGRRRSTRPTFDVEQFERLGADRPYVVALQNEQGTAEPLTRAEALQDRRQGAADRPPAAARAARPDRGRGGADPARRRRRGRPLPARLRRARPGRPSRSTSSGWATSSPTRSARSGSGEAESDWLNRLVVAGGLDWRQVTILRAYREYRQLLGRGVHVRYQNDCLVRNAAIARKLVRLFELRFDPAGAADAAAERRARRRDPRRPGRRRRASTTTASCAATWA